MGTDDAPGQHITLPAIPAAPPTREAAERAARIAQIAAPGAEGPFTAQPADLALTPFLQERWPAISIFLNAVALGATQREAALAANVPIATMNAWFYSNVALGALMRQARAMAAHAWADDMLETADRLPSAGQHEIRGLAEAARIKQWLAETANPESFGKTLVKAAVAITINTNLDLKGTAPVELSKDVQELGGGYTIEAIVPQHKPDPEAVQRGREVARIGVKKKAREKARKEGRPL